MRDLARPVAMADICSVASVWAFLKKSNTMCSWVDDLLLMAGELLMLRCICCVLDEGGGWKHNVGVRFITDMIASSDKVVMLLFLCFCVDDLILFGI